MKKFSNIFQTFSNFKNVHYITIRPTSSTFIQSSTNWAMQPHYIKLQYFIMLIDVKQQTKYIWKDHEICINSKSTRQISVFCLDLEFFHNFPSSRIVQSPPSFIRLYGNIWPVWLDHWMGYFHSCKCFAVFFSSVVLVQQNYKNLPLQKIHQLCKNLYQNCQQHYI